MKDLVCVFINYNVGEEKAQRKRKAFAVITPNGLDAAEQKQDQAPFGIDTEQTEQYHVTIKGKYTAVITIF